MRGLRGCWEDRSDWCAKLEVAMDWLFEAITRKANVGSAECDLWQFTGTVTTPSVKSPN